nr:EOG090X0E0D [Triops cancriformis]
MAGDFRKFWGKKSELRRFQDGTVAEAVVWAGPNYAGRRTVVKQIVEYILQQHFQISQEEFHYVAHQLESLIHFPVLENHLNVYGTGEEMEVAAVRVTDELSKQLRRLENLPLAITAVQGIAPVYRNADVFPHIPNLPRGPKKARTVEGNRCVPLADKFVVPTYVKHHELLITLEASNKWPEEYEAVLRVKTAFYLQLAAQLKKQFNINTIPHYTHVDAFKDGYVFRVSISYLREVALLKRVMVDGEVQTKDTEKSMQLERKISLLPKLTGALHGLHQQQPAYSAGVRLALRWLSCHMLLPYVPEIVVELIMASLFVEPGLYTQPCNTSESTKDDNMLGISWHDSAWIPNLNAGNIMDYFTERSNPFYDRTCNNEIVKMQRLSMDQLNNMTGLEYILLHVQEPILYVVRKQHRHSASQVTPLTDYYIVAGVVYQAPDLGSVINSRILTTVSHLQSAFDEAVSFSQYHPSKGYWWEFKDKDANDKDSKKKEKLKEEPSSLFQRQRVDMLLAELTKKFPPKVATPPNATENKNTSSADENKVDIKVEIKTEPSSQEKNGRIGTPKPPQEKRQRLS